MIGVSSTAFCEQSVEETLEAVSKEFRHWEIFSEGEHYLPHILGRFGSVAPSYDLKYSIHAPAADVNIAALSERMREASTLELMSTMEQAIQMEVTMVTIHPGLYSLIVRGQEKKSIERAKRSLRTLDRVTAEFGITMAVENMPSFRFMLGRTAQELNELVDGTGMGICFDIGHANTTGQTEKMIETFGDRIVNVHVHDNNGQNDEHLTLGSGTADIASAIKKMRGYGKNHIIESKSLGSAAESRDILSRLL